MNNILEFYKGKRANQEGLYLKDIMKFNDEQLEKNHFYIQWLFPLKEPSLAIVGSPVISDEEIQHFMATWDTEEERKETIALKLFVLEALNKMLSFYGLTLATFNDKSDGRTSLVIKKQRHFFDNKAKNWLTPKNHNFLRLTRILSSLKLLGEENSARMLHDCLCGIYDEHKGVIGPLTKQFWDEAMEEKDES